jgi:aryl-alcohol dehydrogenase-like predicted oxidoreductase
MALAGKATIAGTQAYRARYRGLASSVLGATGLRISQAGFGGYRVAAGHKGHHDALVRALRNGINLIDTSSNYSDGQSEALVGDVLAGLVADGVISRDQIVVVSKVGYIQGQNMQLARQREEQGKPYPEMVKLEDNLWHCLHPDFLRDQLERSLLRLDLETIDVYLLHNPEYFLKSRGHHPSEADRREYDGRLQEAFRYLESEVAAGRIGCYGVSSNTFPEPADDPTFTSLTRCLDMAAAIRPDHHFQVIQLPGNLYESGFAFTPNQPDGDTVLETARRHDLGVMINRPLNAFHNNRLIRLADVPPGKVVPEAIIQQSIDEVRQAEQVLLVGGMVEATMLAHLQPLLVVGELLEANMPFINGREQWHDVVNYYVIPRVDRVLHIASHSNQPALAHWQLRYEGAVQHMLSTLEQHFRRISQEFGHKLELAVNEVLDQAQRRLSLSQKAIFMLRSLPGVDVVLVGMREESYVDDVLGALAVPALADPERAWRNLQLP